MNNTGNSSWNEHCYLTSSQQDAQLQHQTSWLGANHCTNRRLQTWGPAYLALLRGNAMNPIKPMQWHLHTTNTSANSQPEHLYLTFSLVSFSFRLYIFSFLNWLSDCQLTLWPMCWLMCRWMHWLTLLSGANSLLRPFSKPRHISDLSR